MEWVDTHCHIDGTEFDADRETVIQRAREAGVGKILVPAIDLASSERILSLCQQYPDYLCPMVGLHPEEVRADWREQLAAIKSILAPRTSHLAPRTSHLAPRIIAIGEVGLDYYWSREFEQEQLETFEEQVRWSVETRLPLMIHCRKAQNEMVALLKKYFVLGIGGVLTFKKSHLPEVLPAVVPLDRLVIETDAPYMAPVPCRGQRNEPAYTRYVLTKLAESYGVGEEEICRHTNENVKKVFGIQI